MFAREIFFNISKDNFQDEGISEEDLPPHLHLVCLGVEKVKGSILTDVVKSCWSW